MVGRLEACAACCLIPLLAAEPHAALLAVLRELPAAPHAAMECAECHDKEAAVW